MIISITIGYLSLNTAKADNLGITDSLTVQFTSGSGGFGNAPFGTAPFGS